ncbi:MAG: hypothetical protein IKQ33_01785 [Clostridia bacterium]|nr:hypothetical protein [Clostridia bacterium]
MNYNEYMEVINGELTFKEIATRIVGGKTVGIGWTDEVFTHFDIIFKLGLDVKEGSFQRGIRPDYLFVSIIDHTSFGFRADSIKEGSYIEEKLRINDMPKLDDLINGVIQEIINLKK